MDAEWSGDESKTGAAGGVSSADCPGSPPPVSPAPPSTSPAATGAGRRRSANKRVVTVPLADVSGPRPKGVGEGNTPTDAWAWRKYGQKPIKGSPYPRSVSQNNPLFLSQLLAGVASGQTDLTACCSIS